MRTFQRGCAYRVAVSRNEGVSRSEDLFTQKTPAAAKRAAPVSFILSGCVRVICYPRISPSAAATAIVLGTLHLNRISSTRATMPIRIACQETPNSSVPA